MFMLRKKKECGDEKEFVDSATAEENNLEPVIAEDSVDSDNSEDSESSEDSVDSEGSEDDKDFDEVLAAFSTWLEDSVPEKERREAAVSAMSKVCESLCEGRCDETVFDIIAKGADYERAVSEAEHVGEVRGRNASIDELMAVEREDDGVPHPGSGGGDVANRAPNIFDLAREAY